MRNDKYEDIKDKSPDDNANTNNNLSIAEITQFILQGQQDNKNKNKAICIFIISTIIVVVSIIENSYIKSPFYIPIIFGVISLISATKVLGFKISEVLSLLKIVRR